MRIFLLTQGGEEGDTTDRAFRTREGALRAAQAEAATIISECEDTFRLATEAENAHHQTDVLVFDGPACFAAWWNIAEAELED